MPAPTKAIFELRSKELMSAPALQRWEYLRGPSPREPPRTIAWLTLDAPAASTRLKCSVASSSPVASPNIVSHLR